MSSPIRGRALIICNSEGFGRNTETRFQADVDNLAGLLEDLRFEVTIRNECTVKVCA